MRELVTGLTRGELIPRFVDCILPVPLHEREIALRMDGLRTVHELATPEVDVAAVCALVLELASFGAIVLDEVIVGAESADEGRRPPATAPHDEPSPLITAVLAHLASV